MTRLIKEVLVVIAGAALLKTFLVAFLASSGIAAGVALVLVSLTLYWVFTAL
jgi:hypothetical protein